MESGAKGCEVVVSGKLRAARAKSMKFTDGFMIHSGQPVRDFVDTATRHVLMRQGVLGIKVKIMRPWDPEGRMGPSKPLPDVVTSAFTLLHLVRMAGDTRDLRPASVLTRPYQ